MSQEALAELSSVSPATIKLIERGKTSPKASTLKSLAVGLAMDANGKLDADAYRLHHLALFTAAGYGNPDPPAPSVLGLRDRANQVLEGNPDIVWALAQIDYLDTDDAEMIIQVVEYVARKAALAHLRDAERGSRFGG